MAFLLRSRHVVDLFAATDDVRLLALDQAALEALSEAQPGLALRLVLNLSRILCAKAADMHQKVLGRANDG
jgi:CRP-like cAMP-binding protein